MELPAEALSYEGDVIDSKQLLPTCGVSEGCWGTALKML